MSNWTSEQIINFASYLGMAVIGLLAIIGKRFGMNRESAPPQSRDVAIDSVTIADRRALEHLAETLRTSNEIARGHREHDQAILYELKEMNKTQGRIEHLLGRMLDKVR